MIDDRRLKRKNSLFFKKIKKERQRRVFLRTIFYGTDSVYRDTKVVNFVTDPVIFINYLRIHM